MRCCLFPTRSFQKAVAAKLAPIEVDPNDKSIKAYLTRFRNAALNGMTQDIHAIVPGDEKLSEVSRQIRADAEWPAPDCRACNRATLNSVGLAVLDCTSKLLMLEHWELLPKRIFASNILLGPTPTACRTKQ